MRDELDHQHWEREFALIKEGLAVDPPTALPELERLVERLLEASGILIVSGEADGLTPGERELVTQFLVVREITSAYERGEAELSSGDIAWAINGLLVIYDSLVIKER